MELLPQTEKSQSVTPQATAILLLSYLANIDKSNVAVAPFYFGLSMVLLLKSDCPISMATFWSLNNVLLSFVNYSQCKETVGSMLKC